MKFLTAFLLFIASTTFAQTIDCAVFAKINEAQTKLKTTTRMRTTTTAAFGTMESTTEMDTSKNLRILMKLPQMGALPASTAETRMIKGIIYSKTAKDSVWYYKVQPPQDSAQMATYTKTIEQGKDCKIVGTETIDGQLLTIIESSILMTQISDKPTVIRSWYNLKDSTIRKNDISQETKKGMQMTITVDYGAVISPIEKPLNAVPDSLRSKKTSPKRIPGAYANGNDKNMVVIPEQYPEYKDGYKAMFDFMKKNLVYPQAAKDAKLEGSVYLKFIVEIDGTLTDIRVARGIGSGCDEAAVELIKKTSGDWKSAVDGGKPVRTPFTLPIKFKL